MLDALYIEKIWYWLLEISSGPANCTILAMKLWIKFFFSATKPNFPIQQFLA